MILCIFPGQKLPDPPGYVSDVSEYDTAETVLRAEESYCAPAEKDT